MKQNLVAPSSRRPSRLWSVAVWASTALAGAAMVGALAGYSEAQRPVGEGELFANDAGDAVQVLGRAEPSEIDNTLRHIRNDLTIEAVSLVSAGGTITASTSSSLIGSGPASPLLAGYLTDGRFGAVAAPTVMPIEIDDVVERESGEVLYEVIQPLDDGSGLLLSYDISELIERRTRARTLPSSVGQLAVAAVILLVAGAGLWLARNRSVRTFREFALESEYLSRQSEALVRHNAELEDTHERLEQALALAEEKNRIRSEFVLMINHEIRTPLTGVVTGAQLLQEMATESLPKEIVDSVVTEGKRLEHLMAQMLAVARVENRGLFFDIATTAVDDLVREISGSAHRPGIEVLLSDIPREISLQTDRTTLSQLVASLADNGLQHGATRVRIGWSETLPFEPMLETGSRPDSALFFLISDDGPGIDPVFLPRIFEKFEKSSFSSGTGLGLYLATLMVEALNSSLSVSTGPSGTTMAVAVPTARSREMVA